MKKQEKRRIAVLLILLLIVVIMKVRMGGGEKGNELNSNVVSKQNVEDNEFVEVLKDGTKLNTSETLKQTKTMGTFEFTNMQLTNQNGQTVLLADVKNTGEAATNMQLVDVIILDKNGEQLTTVTGVVMPLEVGESSQLNISMTLNYANAYDFQIIEKEVE